MLELVIGLIIGGAAGSVGTSMVFKNTIKQALSAENINYKERWLHAVRLLGSEGKLTVEQVKEITSPEMELQENAAPTLSQRKLNNLYSEDRRELEIERAKQGLPPADNLKDMYSEDVLEVMKARMEYDKR